jgi:hypothetical protein
MRFEQAKTMRRVRARQAIQRHFFPYLKAIQEESG